MNSIALALALVSAAPQFPPCTYTGTTSETRIICMGEVTLFDIQNKLTTIAEMERAKKEACLKNLEDAESRPAVITQETHMSLLEFLGIMGIGAVLGTVGTVWVYGKVK